MGLQLADVANDPLVKETLKVFKDAADKEREFDGGPPPHYFEPILANPVFKVLAETDSLDSASAAALASEHLLNFVSLDTVEKQLNPDVVEVFSFMRGSPIDDPAELLTKASPRGLKLIVAAVTATMTGDEFKEMLAEAHPTEIRMMVSEMGGFMTDIADYLTENKSWAMLPPKLVDRYIEGLNNLASVTTGKTQKRLINMVTSELKTEIARAAAAELAAKEPPPPQIDPDSPFERLKLDARKFRPGV